MAAGHNAMVDAGMSYGEASNSIQRLLDKLKKRPPQGGMMPVLGKTMSKGVPYFDKQFGKLVTGLSTKLDDLIELGHGPFPSILQSAEDARRIELNKMIKIPKGEFKKEHERLLNVLKKKDPAALNKERKIQSQEMRKELSSKLDHLIQFQGDPRPRNNLGEFSPQGEGGPDPNAMYKTYVVAPQTPGVAPNKGVSGRELAAGGALALVGGAAGAAGGHGYKSLAAFIKRTARRKK